MTALDHLHDGQCTVDPETGCCTVCGAEHGAPCRHCGGRGHHADGCAEMADRHERIDPLEEALHHLHEAHELLHVAGALTEYDRRTVLPHLEGEEHGWLGGPYLVDVVRAHIDAARQG